MIKCMGRQNQLLTVGGKCRVGAEASAVQSREAEAVESEEGHHGGRQGAVDSHREAVGADGVEAEGFAFAFALQTSKTETWQSDEPVAVMTSVMVPRALARACGCYSCNEGDPNITRRREKEQDSVSLWSADARSHRLF